MDHIDKYMNEVTDYIVNHEDYEFIMNNIKYILGKTHEIYEYDHIVIDSQNYHAEFLNKVRNYLVDTSDYDFIIENMNYIHDKKHEDINEKYYQDYYYYK